MFFFFNQKYCSRTQVVNGIQNSQFRIHNYDYRDTPCGSQMFLLTIT